MINRCVTSNRISTSNFMNKSFINKYFNVISGSGKDENAPNLITSIMSRNVLMLRHTTHVISVDYIRSVSSFHRLTSRPRVINKLIHKYLPTNVLM